MGKPAEVRLPPEAIELLNEILSQHRSAEVSYFGGEVCIWERKSRMKYKAAVKGQG